MSHTPHRATVLAGKIWLLGALAFSAAPLAAQDLWFTEMGRDPGEIHLSRDGGAPRLMFRSPRTPPQGASNAVLKLSSAAINPGDGSIFYSSCLDWYIFRAQSGRVTHAHTHSAQIRDLAFGADPDWLYYSVLPTPQDDQIVPDGEIFRYNLKTREQNRVAVVLQNDLPGSWWGAFTLHEGKLYIGTMGPPSGVFVQEDSKWREVVSFPPGGILGLDFTPDGELLITNGQSAVYGSRDFQPPQVVREFPGHRIKDIHAAPDAANR